MFKRFGFSKRFNEVLQKYIYILSGTLPQHFDNLTGTLTESFGNFLDTLQQHFPTNQKPCLNLKEAP